MILCHMAQRAQQHFTPQFLPLITPHFQTNLHSGVHIIVHSKYSIEVSLPESDYSLSLLQA